jgi:hypothetical protein
LRQGRQDRCQAVQGLEAHLRRPERHRPARRRVTHPGGQLTGEARPILDQQNIAPAPARSLMNAKPLTVKRMPRVLDPGEATTVC